MSTIGDYVQTGDWKGEKHVPIITVEGPFVANEPKEVRLSLGDAIAHPNTLEHHIAWFKLFYIPEGSKFAVELGNYTFAAHGEYESLTDFTTLAKVQLPKAGKLVVQSYCNIHGLWENTMDVVMA